MKFKIAVVTGAGSGIGQAVSLRLLADGYHVALLGRTRSKLEQTARLSKLEESRCLIAPVDVTDEESVREAFIVISERFGRIDLLFNNAGSLGAKISFEDLSLDEWSSVLKVNVEGAFLCARAAYRVMKAQVPRGGRIINCGSVAAHTPRPNSAHYNASKNALTGLTRSISLEGRRWDIACGQIDIGNAATPQTEEFSIRAVQADGVLRPEPMMSVSEVAEAVSFMASLRLDTNVQFMTIMATKMPYIGRG